MATQAEIQARIDKLETARSSGILTVEFDGRRITYRSLAELDQVLAGLRRQLGGTPVTQIYFSMSKGL